MSKRERIEQEPEGITPATTYHRGYWNTDPKCVCVRAKPLEWTFREKISDSKVLDEDGGKITLKYKGQMVARLNVPANALVGDTKFTLTIPERPDGSTNIYVEITATSGKPPHVISEFEEPLTLTIRYEPINSTGKSALDDSLGEPRMYLVTPGASKLTPSVALGGGHNRKRKIVRAEINHLSGYILAQGLVGDRDDCLSSRDVDSADHMRHAADTDDQAKGSKRARGSRGKGKVP